MKMPDSIKRLLGFADSALPSFSTMGTGAQISFRQCILLCLPALLLGALVRFEMMRAFPVIFYGADSNSYFQTTVDLWTGEGFDVSEKRRWLYPLFLLPLPALPFSPATAVAWFQHLLGLLAVIPLGWIVGHVTRLRLIWIPVVTTVYALWPNALWYEHEMIAEPVFLAAFILTTALAFPLSRLAGKKGICLYLAGAGALALLKTVGKPLWLIFFVFALTFNRRPLAWGRRSWLVVAATILLIATSGSGRQGSWLFLSSTLPYVPSTGSWPEYRTLLKPLIDEARSDLPNYAFQQGRYKKALSRRDDPSPFGVAWAALAKDKQKFQSVTKALAVSAVFNEPLGCARLCFEKILVAGAANRMPPAGFDPRFFHQEQTLQNSTRWDRKSSGLNILYRTPRAEFEQYTEGFQPMGFGIPPFLARMSSFFAWCHASPGSPGQPPVIGLRWSGWLVLAGFLCCLLPGRVVSRFLLWAPSAGYLICCFGVGDALARYLQPVEWAGMILAALALDTLLCLPRRLLSRSREAERQ